MEQIEDRLQADSERSEFDVRPVDLGIGKLFGQVRDAVVVADAKTGRIVLWNPAAERIFGYSTEEALELEVEALVPEDLQDGHRKGMNRYRRTGRGSYIDSHTLLDLPAVRKDGEHISVEFSLNPIDYEGQENGGERFVMAILRETTGRKRAEETRSRLSAIVENSDDAIIGTTLEGNITSWNRGAEEMYGYTQEETLGCPVSMLVPSDRPDETSKILEKIGRGEKVDHYETVRVRKDGRKMHISLTVSPTRDAEGNVVGIATIARNVDRWREAEELRRQKDFYETLLKIQSDIGEGLVIVGDGRIVYANQAFARTSGYSLSELYALTSYLDLLIPEEKDRVADRLFSCAGDEAERIEDRHETAMLNKAGQKVYLDVAVKAFRATGDVQLVAITSDITERKKAEKSLRRSLNSLLTLHEAAQVFGSTLDPDEVCRRLLAMAERVSDFEAAAIYRRNGQDDAMLWHSAGKESLIELATNSLEVQAARRATLETGERRTFALEEADGGPAAACMPLRAYDFSVGVLEVYGTEDTTEEVTLELLGSLTNQAASALENARLYKESAQHEGQLRDLVGKLLAAQEEERRHVAYEIHDGLTQVAIATHQHLQTFAEDHPPGTPVEEGVLNRVLSLAKRTVVDARQVIAGLRPTTLDDFGLAAAIRQELAALRAEGFEVEYEENFGEKRLPDQVETTLYRVFQEALTNVRKHSGASLVQASLKMKAGGVKLEVRDDGRGFDPRSVPDTGGPGERIGLTSMRERISLTGGRLEIQSNPGEGAAVSAEVPIGRRANAPRTLGG